MGTAGEPSREALARKLKSLEVWMPQLLRINGVSTEADLYDLARVLLCKPETKQV